MPPYGAPVAITMSPLGATSIQSWNAGWHKPMFPTHGVALPSGTLQLVLPSVAN
jgi:hypothetical protein